MSLMQTKNELQVGVLEAEWLDIISQRRIWTIRGDYHVLGNTKLGGESVSIILHDEVVILGAFSATLCLENHHVSIGNIIIRDVVAMNKLGPMGPSCRDGLLGHKLRSWGGGIIIIPPIISDSKGSDVAVSPSDLPLGNTYMVGGGPIPEEVSIDTRGRSPRCSSSQLMIQKTQN